MLIVYYFLEATTSKQKVVHRSTFIVSMVVPVLTAYNLRYLCTVMGDFAFCGTDWYVDLSWNRLWDSSFCEVVDE